VSAVSPSLFCACITYLTAQQATTPGWFGEASTTQAGVYGVVSGGVSAGIGMALAATSGGGVTIQFTGCEL
jgi:TPP-dependent trihydroxycyclohexane-1,2-dione (THcHDO) dehydratase